jgi:hypothetical protein
MSILKKRGFELFSLASGLLAQNVGIGTATPHVGARLHVDGGGSRGVLLPQAALTAANAWAPVAGAAVDGMIIYNTASAGTGTDQVMPGYYYWRAGRWRRFSENGYAGMTNGVLHGAAQNLTVNAPNWQYLNSYIDLPPGRWIVFSTQLLSIGAYMPSNASIWVRTSFSESNTTFAYSPDIVGSRLISGLLPPSSPYGLVLGQVIIRNTSGVTKRYYYWGGKQTHNTTVDLYDFSTDTYGENQLFALPAE